MPAKPPVLSEHLAPVLRALGERLAARRKQLKLSATSTAEAAGLSRVTLHRIERGEPAVTLGAYLGVADALGLRLEWVDPKAPASAELPLPERLRVGDYPQLRRLAWQLPVEAQLSPAEALSLYERNWRHLDPGLLEPAERSLLQRLSTALGGGRLLV